MDIQGRWRILSQVTGRGWEKVAVATLSLIGIYDLMQGQFPERNLPCLDQVIQGWDWKIWFILALIVALIATFEGSYRYVKHKETSLSRAGQTANVREPTLKEDFQNAKVAWALWYAGTKARVDKVLEVRIPARILLPNPDEDNDALLRVIKESDAPLDAALADIKFLTRWALRLKDRIQVRWYSSYQSYTLTIYDPTPLEGKNSEPRPNSGNAWLVRSTLDPKVGAGERTRERIFNKGKDAEKFKGYLERFEEIWEQSSKVKLVADDKVQIL